MPAGACRSVCGKYYAHHIPFAKLSAFHYNVSDARTGAYSLRFVMVLQGEAEKGAERAQDEHLRRQPELWIDG